MDDDLIDLDFDVFLDEVMYKAYLDEYYTDLGVEEEITHWIDQEVEEELHVWGETS